MCRYTLHVEHSINRYGLCGTRRQHSEAYNVSLPVMWPTGNELAGVADIRKRMVLAQERPDSE